jgi:hypothetical protein
MSTTRPHPRRRDQREGIARATTRSSRRSPVAGRRAAALVLDVADVVLLSSMSSAACAGTGPSTVAVSHIWTAALDLDGATPLVGVSDGGQS